MAQTGHYTFAATALFTVRSGCRGCSRLRLKSGFFQGLRARYPDKTGITDGPSMLRGGILDVIKSVRTSLSEIGAQPALVLSLAGCEPQMRFRGL